MATSATLFFSLDPQPLHLHHHLHHRYHQPPIFTGKHTHHPLLTRRKSNFTLPLSTSHSSSSSSLSPPQSPSPAILEENQYPLHSGQFLTNEELQKLHFLENYAYHQDLQSGSLCIRVMREEEMDATVALLSESFAESMMLPKAYVKVLGFLVKQYLLERSAVMPYAATLVGLYRDSDDEDDDVELAGTVEVCFDQRGANANSPSPTPPKNQPYISNMTVKKPLRRYLSRATSVLL